MDCRRRKGLTMKKYVLKDESGEPLYTTEDPSNVADKLRYMESHGIAIGALTVMTIDTEKYPPVTESAKEFLKKSKII
jgi:hypothetical protein